MKNKNHKKDKKMFQVVVIICVFSIFGAFVSSAFAYTTVPRYGGNNGEFTSMDSQGLDGDPLNDQTSYQGSDSNLNNKRFPHRPKWDIKCW